MSRKDANKLRFKYRQDLMAIKMSRKDANKLRFKYN